MAQTAFSNRLEDWLKSDKDKTLFALSQVFEEKSFAILIMLLMFPSSLPIPTGGITNIFEIITFLLCLEMIAGRQTIWLPQKWGKKRLGKATAKKIIPFINKRIRWFERFSRRRQADLINNPQFSRLTGLVLLVFALGAFVSPPFLGLDTLPSLGAVIVSLAIILDDIVIYIIGCVVGAIGVGLLIGLYDLVLKSLQHIL